MLSTAGAEAPQDLDQSEPDRRIRIADAPTVALAALRWPHRPKLTAGSPSWTYMVEAPGNRFAVFVGHVENGATQPFEVWVNGEQTPRGLAALAKNLSMDMRAQDRAWLEAEAREPGEDAGRAVQRGDAAGRPGGAGRRRGPRLRQGGAVPLRGARGVRRAGGRRRRWSTRCSRARSRSPGWTARCRGPSTSSTRRPATTSRCSSRSACCPTASKRPFSVWLSGAYPIEFNGLTKSLEPRHAGDRPGVDRQEAARAQGPARGAGRLLRPGARRRRSRRCSPRRSPTWRGC